MRFNSSTLYINFRTLVLPITQRRVSSICHFIYSKILKIVELLSKLQTEIENLIICHYLFNPFQKFSDFYQEHTMKIVSYYLLWYCHNHFHNFYRDHKMIRYILFICCYCLKNCMVFTYTWNDTISYNEKLFD